MTTVRIRRLTGKTARLEAIASGLVSSVQDSINAQLLVALDIMQTEPPPKAGSDYVRTHTYQRSWIPTFAHITSGDVRGELRGDAVDPRGHRYTVWVGGDDAGFGQQLQHAETGWPLANTAVRSGQSSSGSVSRGDDFVERIRNKIRKL